MEWLDKLEIKPTQPQFKLGLMLGLNLAIFCKEVFQYDLEGGTLRTH